MGEGPTQLSRVAVAERRPGPADQRVVGVEALDVGLGEAVVAQVGGGALAVRVVGVGGAVGEAAPQVRIAGRHLVAVAAQIELGDHELVEQPDDVGAGGDEEAVVLERPLDRAGAAELLAPLQHEHRLAGPGQIGGRGEPVVPAADDDRVPIARGQLGDRHRQPDLPFQISRTPAQDAPIMPAGKPDLGRSRRPCAAAGAAVPVGPLRTTPARSSVLSQTCFCLRAGTRRIRSSGRASGIRVIWTPNPTSTSAAGTWRGVPLPKALRSSGTPASRAVRRGRRPCASRPAARAARRRPRASARARPDRRAARSPPSAPPARGPRR